MNKMTQAISRQIITRICKDTSRLFFGITGTSSCRFYSKSQEKSQETDLVKQLKAKIKFSGPLTVADYMREVLTNPVAGYYMHRDVLGQQGDFTTSPEISQMFGELIGIWCINEWMQCGSPPHIQVVELGPGRGTLCDDMLRVFAQFPGISDAVSLHLVEVSPKLSEMQQDKLCGAVNPKHIEGHGTHYKSATSKHGPEVHWHTTLRTVPKNFSFFVAHEFLDALPIHKFHQKDGKLSEILVAVDDTPEGPHHLRYVLSPTETAVSTLLLDKFVDEPVDHFEICPDAGIIIADISKRIAEDGGFGLIADYGHLGDKTDTFRAFKEHKQINPLQEPGTADLTADVDFSYLSKIATPLVNIHGPICQEKFLHFMGIQYRLQKLYEAAPEDQRKHLITGYDMLTNPQKMGDRFKFLALLEKGRPLNYQPAGFVPPK